MIEPSAGDASLACASALIASLVQGGAVGASISPGSRSTPLALALSRDGRIPLRVHLDERSSAFFALGMAKATGRPALVVTTSGTAAANLLPAVVEASMSRIPLIVLTADRPPEWRGTGANQTIDQAGLFGSYPRWAQDAEPPDTTTEAVRAWAALGARAVDQAVGPPGGPVHLNLPFREPLVPSPFEPAVPDGSSRGDARRSAPLTVGYRDIGVPADGEAVERLAASVTTAERGVLVVGWLDPWSSELALEGVERLAAMTGWPLVAEPLSGLRRPPFALSAAQHLLMDQPFADTHAPEVVIQLGGTPTSRAAQALVARAAMLAVVGEGPADPEHRADIELRAHPASTAGLLSEYMARPEPAPSAWSQDWREADAVARAAVDATLDRCDEPFEGRMARDLAAAVPEGVMLFVGSSMPVRDLDAYMAPRSGLRVVGNRGASGIDGSVSTTLGMAAAARTSHARTPTFALLGDLALLHDAGALLWGGRQDDPVVFVVPNNDGGGIFDHLAVSTVPEHERLFVTPHGLDLGALAAAAGVGHELVDRPDELSPAISRAAGLGGVRIIEVPIDRQAGLRMRAEVRDAVRSALSGLA